MMGLAEIREAEAPADTAAIYAQIKEASGLPLVNLIWRHFAALPGVLPWAWAAVEPLVRSTSMAEARRRLAVGIALPSPIGFDWREAGLEAGAIARVSAIIRAYTRGNLTNLLALTALRLRLEQPQARPGVLLPPAAAQPAEAPLDPLPSFASLSPEVAALVRALADRHGGPAAIIPSLYLHFAHWPRLLEVLPRGLAALYAPGALEAAREATRRLAEVEAAVLLPHASPPPAGMEDATHAALAQFTTRVIPDLLPVCLALRQPFEASAMPA
jgi:hypothetical protein